MSSSGADAPGPSGPGALPRSFTFHVGAVLGPRWTEWFEGSEILARGDGTAHIIAEVRDQAMLFGLLLRIRDLGVPLLGVYPGNWYDHQVIGSTDATPDSGHPP